MVRMKSKLMSDEVGYLPLNNSFKIELKMSSYKKKYLNYLIQINHKNKNFNNYISNVNI